MNNSEKFKAALTEAYTDLFKNDPEYAYSASRSTPESLAERMTTALMTGEGNKDGEGIKRACKAVGIKQTYKEINAFLNPDNLKLSK